VTTSRVPAGTPAGGRFTTSSRPEPNIQLDFAAPAPDWRDTPVVVEGRRFLMGQVAGGQLFHGSPVQLEVGDVLEPGHGRNHTQSAAAAVSITSDEGRAGSWARDAAKGQPYFVYEVEPAGPVQVWRAGLAEYGTSFCMYEARTPAARIVGVMPHISTP